jgi:hypothetical protein
MSSIDMIVQLVEGKLLQDGRTRAVSGVVVVLHMVEGVVKHPGWQTWWQVALRGQLDNHVRCEVVRVDRMQVRGTMVMSPWVRGRIVGRGIGTDSAIAVVVRATAVRAVAVRGR